ncbi:hypothetical protein ABZ897_02700 [Nonomuraea sp. NPDC046802]|uniref:hypothetical protein n=1 Tax=Nonomuraea sp. NPDC046802 TaxID=3154919 RepID=UPI0033BFE69B
MTRNGPDDATRKGTSEVDAVEGLLAYAQSRSRWGGAALSSLSEAIALSRTLAEKSPGEHTVLLARCLRTTAGHLLKRNRAVEALPLAQEAVALTRSIGGAPLVVALTCLASAYEALHRYSEAAATLAEADEITPPDD